MIKKLKYHLISEEVVNSVSGVYFHAENEKEKEEITEELVKEYNFKNYKVKLNPEYNS